MADTTCVLSIEAGEHKLPAGMRGSALLTMAGRVNGKGLLGTFPVKSRALMGDILLAREHEMKVW